MLARPRSRRRLLPLLVLLATGAAVTCATTPPPIDVAAKADLDRRLAAVVPSAHHFTDPSAPAPMPMAVGQWLTYKLVDARGEPSLVTLKVVGQQGRHFWYETVVETYYGKSVTAMLIDFGDPRNPDSVVIKAARIKDSSGRVAEYPEATVGLVGAMLRGRLGPLFVDWTGLPQEEASVPAGRFAGCFKGRSQRAIGGQRASSVTWGHSAVPISGLVKSLGDDRATTELVGFGTTGAQSEFPDR
jgi:hypothetical protein